jgi:hypothetical protein
VTGGDGAGHGALTVSNTGVIFITAGQGISTSGGATPTLAQLGPRVTNLELGGPLSVTFSFSLSYSTNTVAFAMSASGWSTVASSLMQINWSIDGGGGFVWNQFTNEASSHKTFHTMFASRTNMTAGSHTLTFANGGNMTSDTNDRYTLQVIELPAN